MEYTFTKKAAPKLPFLGKGTEIVKILLSQASKDMREPLLPMLFPVIGAHISGTEFMYPDRTWKEPCGIMAHLVADSGTGKGQLAPLVEAVCRRFRRHDEAELQKLVSWQVEVKTKSANKEKPARPEVCFRFPPSDVTHPAFIQNAMALEAQGGHTQLLNIPEVEMADRMCGGHRQVSQMIRNIYDRQRAGALRATADGITGNPTLRVNLTISSTPFAARKFYKNELFNGTFGRMVFSYKPRQERTGRIPRQGKFNEDFYELLDRHIASLEACRGRFVIHPLNRLADKLAEDMARLADLSDDDLLWDISKRAIVSAWKAGCILWITAGQKWTKAMAELVEWLVYHDIWSKLQVFADLLEQPGTQTAETCRRGPKNMLDSLPNTFSAPQLEALRASLDKSADGTDRQLRVWANRGFISFDAASRLYTKTPEYLKTNPS